MSVKHTVKLVYCDRIRGTGDVVAIDRKSLGLYLGLIFIERGAPAKDGPNRQGVALFRWSHVGVQNNMNCYSMSCCSFHLLS